MITDTRLLERYEAKGRFIGVQDSRWALPWYAWRMRRKLLKMEREAHLAAKATERPKHTAVWPAMVCPPGCPACVVG